MSGVVRRSLLLAAGVWVALGGSLCTLSCSQESHSGGPTITCSAVGGVWAMSVDYGNGLVGHQTWDIVQSGCDVTLTGNPPDLYGPYLDSNSAHGTVGGDGLWARWTHRAAPCEYNCEVDATVSGDVMSGTLIWVRDPYGVGYCVPASGQFAVSGTR
jgi:hypothetical protein